MLLTKAVTQFAVELDFELIPAAVLHATKRCILDGVGVELASMHEPVIAVLDKYIDRVAGRPEVRAISGGNRRLPAHLAALRNGTAGHAMDWDDTQLPAAPDRLFGFLTHPTTTPLAAALALVDRTRIDGRRFLTAFLAGFEVECKIAEAISADHARYGYQSTATIGTFGAAATAAKLAGAGATGMAQTMGMAASMAAGIKANHGTMAKLVHVGRAAENGIIAADLISDGLTASETALDGEVGYLAAAGRGGNPERVIDQFGDPFSILEPGVSIKPYPSGVVTHQTMDAVLDVMRAHSLSADDVDSIEALVGKNIAEPIRFPFAQSALEARYCLPFLIAAMALDGRAGPEQFTDAYVSSARVVDFERRVKMRIEPKIDALGYEKIRSQLVFRLRTGQEILHDVDERYRGGPERPLTDTELEQKFRSCLDGKLLPERVRELANFIWHLEDQSDASTILDLTNS